MEKSIKEYLDELRRKQDELRSVSRDLIKMRELYRQKTNEQKNLNDEVYNLHANQIFQVRVGDFLEELSYLANIPVDEIKIKLFFDSLCRVSGKMDVESIKKNLNVVLPGIVFEICDSDGYFKYFGTSSCYTKSELPIIQADGKSLFDHSSFRYAGLTHFGDLVAPVIDRNIEDIILKINLGLLDKKECSNWYPSDLFVKAIENCLEKEQQQQKVKAFGNQ